MQWKKREEIFFLLLLRERPSLPLHPVGVTLFPSVATASAHRRRMCEGGRRHLHTGDLFAAACSSSIALHFPPLPLAGDTFW